MCDNCKILKKNCSNCKFTDTYCTEKLQHDNSEDVLYIGDDTRIECRTLFMNVKDDKIASIDDMRV